MAKVFMMLNPSIRIDNAQRFWLEVGDTIKVSNRQRIEVSRVRFDDDLDDEGNQLLLTEYHDFQQTHVHTVSNKHWLLLPTRRGYIEVIPKAIAFNSQGRVDKLLVDLLETPAQGAIHAQL